MLQQGEPGDAVAEAAVRQPERVPERDARRRSLRPIPEDVVETINATYARAARREPWRAGDLLLVDNLRTAHSRDPYEGEREVVVVLGDPVRLPGHVLREDAGPRASRLAGR
ncbi:TauD/TfdA family dioxygenase [Streptacidiphilus rugosus]|uniref:TauD/TfdA family dioxygenase n=1 Tax=Streptacidiphilus rugosus TaxID=405783 RepID=UPI002FBD4AAD